MSTTTRQSQDALSLSEAKQLFENQAAVGRRTEQSVGAYMAGVKTFTEWCEQKGFTTLDDLTKRNVGGFSPWLGEQDRWAEPTKHHYSNGARQFLKFLEERDEIPDGMHSLVKSYHVEPSDRQSDNKISVSRLDAILDYVTQHHPSHRNTVLLQVLNLGLRTCAAHSLDVDDVRLDDHGRPEIAVENRPHTGSKLKEGDRHERYVPIPRELFDDIKLYVEHHREDVEDDHGRSPLFTSRHGRLSKSQMKDVIYQITCGQHNGLKDCECESKPSMNDASGCSMSEGPHAIRAAAVVRYRDAGHTFEDISEMVAAEPSTLKQNYDRADKSERADRARSLLNVM